MSQLQPPCSLPIRHQDSHKGDFGKVLLVGGSRGMTGAISLSGLACLKSGAGLVTIATPQSCQPLVAGFHPGYMTIPLPESDLGMLSETSEEPLVAQTAGMDVLGWGPGLGRGSELSRLTRHFVESSSVPMVLDADGLFGISEDWSGLTTSKAPLIITPHLGEFRRLAKRDFGSREEAESFAIESAREKQCIIVLKGNRTLVTDGSRNYHNETGNPGMATGGSGDVLTGIISALLGQSLSPYDASCLGVFVHGLAGDLAAQKVGEISLLATDLIHFLPTAFQTLS